MKRGWWVATLLWPVADMAVATHITDQLTIALYDSPQQAPPSHVAGQPRRELASDTPVEILEQGAEWCRVRLGDGDGGWLQCSYLTEDKPARALLLEVQASAAQLRQELADLQQRRIAQIACAVTAPSPSTLPKPPQSRIADTWAAGGFALGALAAGLAAILGRRQRDAQTDQELL
jgi:hypothetical protein